MARANALINNLSGGEVSPRIWARPEVTKVKNGARTIENAIVSVHGGAFKRPGSRFIIDLPSTNTHVLIPFQYSTEQSYQLIFGQNFVWFCKEYGIITHATKTITGITKANPAVVTAAAHGFTNGDKVYITGVSGMTEVNNRWFVVANKTTDTFELTEGGSNVNATGYTTYASGGAVGEIVELTTTYSWAELPYIQTAQINDVMYITHPDHPPRKLSRFSDVSWTLSEPAITTGPFRTVNADSTLTLTPSSFSASATSYGTHQVGEAFTLTASASLFTADHVGAYWRLSEEGGGTGIAGAPIGDSTKAISNGDVYTYQGNVYGVSSVSTITTWEKVTRVPEHDQGSVVVNASGGGGFTSNFLHPTYCIVQVIAYTSATVVTAQIVRYQMPESIVSGGTSYWEEGAWSDERGWPQAITLHEQRLFFGGNTSEPTAIWGSQSGAYEEFADGADDDDAIVYRLTSGKADVIRWMASRRILTAGTSQGEYAISASSQQEALTPTNVRAVMQTDVGTSYVVPVAIDQAVLYPQRYGDPDNAAVKLREFAYAFSDDRFNSVDLTVFAEHIFGTGITRLAYQRDPESLIWACRADGTLASCTYERLQEVVAWHRHVLGGTSSAVKSVACKAGALGDELWMQVNRTVNGVTVAYIEALHPRFREHIDTKAEAKLLDCSLVYSGAEVSSITGLWHLRGETVTYLADGDVYAGTVSSVGALTLEAPASTVCVGYPFTMVLEPTELEAGAQAGTAQSRVKRISKVYIRVLKSLGGVVESRSGTRETIRYRESTDLVGSAGLHDGLVDVDHPGGYSRDLRIRIEHDEPVPFYVAGIVAEQDVSG